MKKIISLALCLLLLLSLCACGQSKAAKAAQEAISQIGEVTYSSDSKITAAEELFNSLTDKEKKTVENAAELTAARDSYNAMVLEAVNKHSEEIAAITAAVKEADFTTCYELIQTVREELNTMDPTLYTMIADAVTDSVGSDPLALIEKWEAIMEEDCIPNTHLAFPQYVIKLEPYDFWEEENNSITTSYYWSTTYGRGKPSFKAYEISAEVLKEAYEEYKAYVSKYVEITEAADFDEFSFQDDRGEHVLVWYRSYLGCEAGYAIDITIKN